MRATKGSGPTADKMASMLTEKLGIFVRVSDLWFQSPHWIRYGGCAVWGGISEHRTYCSWDTMTECIRRGFTVEDCTNERNSYADYEIYVIPKEQPNDHPQSANRD